MNAPAHRYNVRWSETRVFSADLEISLAELAEWAVANLPLHSLGRLDPEAPKADQLTVSLERNPHLLNRLALQFAKAQNLGRLEGNAIDELAVTSPAPERSHEKDEGSQ